MTATQKDIDAFNKMKAHLLAQNEQSRRAGMGRCAYRGDNNTKCAVGCLIPDSEYQIDFEHLQTHDVIARCPSLWGIDTSLLMTMQRMHDATSPVHWPARLDEIELELRTAE
jgi:hypothetical protein